MAGWIKLYRDIQDHWLSQDYEKLGWWVDLLFLAAYKDCKKLVGNRIIELKRGQLHGSISFFVDRWGTTKDKVINYLKMLQLEGMVDKKSDKNVTIITICKYESYQDGSNSLPDNLSYSLSDNLPDNLPDTNKEIKEVKNNNITNNHAHTREGDVPWVADVEKGYLERFKAQGAAMKVARITGKNKQEIDNLLDVYMATREFKNKGHKNFEQFNNLFLWSVQNGKIQPKSADSKVSTNQDHYRLMKEMGWQSN